MRSNLVNAMIDGCRVKARTSDEYTKWLAEYEALEDKIEKLHPELFDVGQIALQAPTDSLHQADTMGITLYNALQSRLDAVGGILLCTLGRQ